MTLSRDPGPTRRTPEPQLPPGAPSRTDELQASSSPVRGSTLGWIEDLPGERRPLRGVEGFFTQGLIRALEEEGLLPGTGWVSEGVAVYLAHLMEELAGPEGLERYEALASPWQFDLGPRIDKRMGPRERLTLYRTNADYWLISLGLFDQPLVGRAGRGQGLKFRRQDLECRGIQLYRWAAATAEGIFGRAGEPTRVLTTLSEEFVRYCDALRELRGRDWSSFSRIGSGMEYHLVKIANGTDQSTKIRNRWDLFLDALGVWKRRRTSLSWQRVLEAAGLLEEVDSTFSRAGFQAVWCDDRKPGLSTPVILDVHERASEPERDRDRGEDGSQGWLRD